MSKLIDFFKTFPKRTLEKRETFMSPGDSPQGIYFIEKGYVRLYALSNEGKEFTFIIYSPGTFFPVVWAFTGKPSDYYFETLSEVSARVIPRSAFIEYVASHGDELLYLTTNIVKRFERMVQRIKHLALGRAYTKVSSMISTLGKEFGEKAGGGEDIVIPIPLTHKDLGSLIGLTREATSIEMEKLHSEGLIDKQGGFIIIKNMKRLEEISSLS